MQLVALPGNETGPGKSGPCNLGHTLFPGIVTAAIVLQAKGMRIHNPTNGAKLRFSGAVGDYTELRC